MKNWTGNKNSIYKTLGASNHAKEDRQEQDYYATDPKAVEMLLELEKFNKKIWEPACGEGHISEVLKNKGYTVLSTDLIDRNYGKGNVDFLKIKENYKWPGDIISNPPYRYAQEFVEKALSLINTNNKVAMFLKIQFLEGKKRKKLFKKYPPKIIYVSSSRLLCAPNGDFEKQRKKGSAVAYCWFIWQKGFIGDPIIKWFN